MADALLRYDDVERKTRLSRTTIWRLERRGEFPARRQITGNTVGWLASEVDEWIASRPLVVVDDDAA